MSWTIKLFWKLRLHIDLLDVNPSDGDVALGLRLSWKEPEEKTILTSHHSTLK